MDFHSLTRRELQALCKKNKIPANLTNVAMADALQALHSVDGIQELLLPTESSIESPAKSHVASLSVPRSTARRKATVKEDEPDTSHTLMRARRSTRRPVAAGGDVDEASGPNKMPQTPAPPINGRNGALAEEELDHNISKEKENFSETPAIVPASRQRGLKAQTTTLKTACSTRRSARLAEKNMEDFNTIMVEEEGSESVRTEIFPNDFGEISESNVQEDCPAESDPVPECSGVDLGEKSEPGLDNSCTSEAFSVSMNNHNSFQIDCDEDRVKNVEIGGESEMTVESSTCDNESDEVYTNTTEDALDNGEKLDINEESDEVYANKTEDALDYGEKLDINEEIGCIDEAAVYVAQVVIHHDTDLETKSEEALSLGLSNNTNASSFEDGRKLNEENEKEFEDGAAQETLADDEKGKEACIESGEYQLDSDLFLPKTEQAVGILTPSAALESMVETGASGEEAFADNLAEKLMAMELNTCAPDVVVTGDITAMELNTCAADDVVPGDMTVLPCLTADSNENITEIAVSSSSLTPMKGMESTTPTVVKKSVSKKTPTTAAKRMTKTQVSDDKENMIDNSGTKLIIAKERKENKQTGDEKPLIAHSLRQLSKMLKEKLEITKKFNTNDNTNDNSKEGGSTARLALQAVSENRLE